MSESPNSDLLLNVDTGGDGDVPLQPLGHDEYEYPDPQHNAHHEHDQHHQPHQAQQPQQPHQDPNQNEDNRGINWNPLGLNLNPLGLNLNPLGLNFDALNLRNLNLNPLDINFNPLDLHVTDLQNLNPLNPVHRERMQHLFSNLQSGTNDVNTKLQRAVSKIRSNEYREKMGAVLTNIKNTKEYQSTSLTDYDVVFESVDMYTNLQQDVLVEKDAIEGGFHRRLHSWMRKERISTLLFIPLLGILIGLMGLMCDMALLGISKGRARLVVATPFYFLNMLLYIAYSVFLAFIAAACVSFISPYAVGSGIPEIKSILSGIDLSRVLGLRTLLAKLIGMVGAVGAGLVVGRTGPFMHASTIIAHELMKLQMFANIRKNQITRHQMMISALAAGVTANFGAPIGGLLFSIEVTGTNCLFGSLWKGLLCACTCAIIFELSRTLTGGVAFRAVYNFEFAPHSYGFLELATFVGMGIVCGLLGAFFVFAYERFVRFRLRYKILRTSRIGLVTVVATLSALAIYISGPFGRLPLAKSMVALLNDEPLYPNLFSNKFFNLGIFIFSKFFLTIFNVMLPIPGGAITPFLVLGAAAGRMYGEYVHANFGAAIIPAGYAVIGAAGLVSGTVRALSPCVFVLELTGQLSLLIPVLICSITATAVGNLFNNPLFDVALKIQNLPFLSNFRSDKVYRMQAKDVMRPNIQCLSMSTPLRVVKEYLAKPIDDIIFIPLVQSEATMVLEGIAERSSLEYVVNTYIKDWTTRYRRHVPNEAILAAPSSPNPDDSERQHLRTAEEITVDEEELPFAPPPLTEEEDGGREHGDVIEVEDEGWKDVMLVDAMNESNTAVLMDFSPSQTPDTTPLNKVFHLFVMLGLSFTFVTRYGALVGVITKRDLIKQEL